MHFLYSCLLTCFCGALHAPVSNQVTPAMIKALRNVPTLRHLDLSEGPRAVSASQAPSKRCDADLQALASVPFLTTLVLMGCSAITSAGWGHLRCLTALTSLDISYSAVLPETLHVFAYMPSLVSGDAQECQPYSAWHQWRCLVPPSSRIC